MKLLVTAFLLSCCLFMSAQDWPAPGGDSRPGSRWWWLGSAVDTANLSHNIREYARAGLGSLEITPIYGVKGNEANDIQYLSPEWMRMLRHAYKAGRENGVRIEMNNGTGWPFGGPEVTPASAAKKAVFKKKTVAGKDDRKVTLAELVNENVPLPDRLMAYSKDGKKIIDLTDEARKGTGSVRLPKGEWTLVSLLVDRTGQKVKRAAPGGEGFVIDHLDKGVVEDYLGKFDKAFNGTDTPWPEVFFNDSYEVYGADWTPTFLDEFRKRRGYSLEHHFPEFIKEDRDETSRRIVSDYRRTMSEILLDNFLRPWTAWAHSHGSKTRNQAHGSPANLIDAYASVDIPECEGFGLSDFNIKGLRKDSISRKNDSDISMLKYASSAAHVTGRPLVSSETFTWLTDHFRTSLSQCKPDMDLMFVAGVNHMFFHGTPYSPKDAPWPGWRFYASINMSPTNPIWRDAPAFFDYITRCQSFLQSGAPDNDFLLYLPIEDMWHELPGRMVAFDIHKMDRYAPRFIQAVDSIKTAGYDVDYISDAILRESMPENGQVRTPGGAAYRAVVVPKARLMPASTLSHMADLAEKGVKVVFVGGMPEDVPGYANLAESRKEFGKALERLRACGGNVMTVNGFSDLGGVTDVRPEEMQSRLGLQYIRRKTDNGHLYFISNLQGKDIDEMVAVNQPGKAAMLFDPMTGEKGMIGMENGKARLQLRSGESVFLQTFDSAGDIAGVPVWNYTEEAGASLVPSGKWSLRFIDGSPSIEGESEIDGPVSFASLDIPGASSFMGTAVYSFDVEIPEKDYDDWVIDLGDVRESARIKVNGKDAGILWAVPYRARIGRFLHKGKNRIDVEVTNLPANHIAEMDRRKEEWRIFKDANIARLRNDKGDFSGWGVIPSGLNSGVSLIPVSYSGK